MKKMSLILAFICLMVIPALANDPGVPDTIIIQDRVYVPYNPGNWSSVLVPVYFVTDDSVADMTVPTLWASSDNQIFIDSVIWHGVFNSWDDTWYQIAADSALLHLSGWSDLGGDPNPPLFTNLQRVLGYEIRFAISPTANPQIVTIDTTRDRRLGSANFGPLDGGASFTPQIVPGSIYYGIATGIEDQKALPTEFKIAQNYPNPFNPVTKIDFALPKSGMVTLDVFNLLGQKVKTLISEPMEAGFHSVIWNGQDASGKSVPSGAYFYKITAGDYRDAKKMMLLK
jgi:hypothetical protein